MLNDYRQLAGQLRNSTWFILEQSLETILEIVNMRLNGTAFSDEEIRIRLQEAENGEREHPRVEIGGGIGMIPLYGPIFPKANMMTELSGATSLENFQSDLELLLNDDRVENIVMDVDSPGGSSAMTFETAEEVRKAREIKPIHAIANTLAASAGYLIASQATKMYSTPTGMVGSIGAYILHEDISAANKSQGRKFTFIKAGRLKTAGNEFEPLSEETREYLQGIVDDSMEGFVEQVALGRGVDNKTILENFGEGGLVTTKKAAEVGMVDGVTSLKDLVGSLLVQNTPEVTGVLSGMIAQHSKQLEVANRAGIKPVLATSKPKEGSKVDEARMRTLLGVSEEDDVEGAVTALAERDSELRRIMGIDENGDLVAAVKETHDELEPIRQATGNAEKEQKFSELFPEEHAELVKGRETRQSTDAKVFAAQYERFSKKDGDAEVKSNIGLPMVTVKKIEEVHTAIATRSMTTAKLGEMLDLIAKQGFVDYAERGSSLGEELSDDPVKQFNSRIINIMTEDKLSAREATKMAATQYSDEYEAYREAMSKTTGTTA